MITTDPIADMLTRIRNASSQKHKSVDVPASKEKLAIAQILFEEGYIKSFEEIKEENNQGVIRITLKYTEKGKKVIVAPRLKKYNEHVNNHQIQIARKFEQQGYVKCVINMKNLGKIIESIKDFQPKQYKKSESNVISIIENYIDNN